MLTIRRERPDDAAPIHALLVAAFARVPESDHREGLLVARLRASAAFIPQLSLVAERDGTLAGSVLLTRVSIVSDDGHSIPSLSVAPLAVLPEFQNRGIGGRLLNEAHARAAALGYGSAVLVGHKDYYPRFGYRRASECGIAFPFAVPDECCMIKALLPHALESLRGRVEYPEAFFA